MISRISNLRKGRDFNPREMVGNKQIVWLNCSKFVAILAVMLDHTNKILYQSSDIAYASYFSVELFVILSGMTSICLIYGMRKKAGGKLLFAVVKK